MKLLIVSVFIILCASCGGGGGVVVKAGSTAITEDPAADPDDTDPLYEYAWHLENTGQTTFALKPGTAGFDVNGKDVITDGIKGLGVTVAISDTGIESGHEDLHDNYTSGISKNFLLASPYNGDPVPNLYSHGTAVTGIIAAVGWNNLGSRGVAPSAKFGGFNFLADGVTQSLEVVLYQMQGSFDIFNYSYGTSTCEYAAMGDTERTSTVNAFVSGVTTLRSNKGALYVKAAGNEYADVYSDDCRDRPNWHPPYDVYLGNANFSEGNNYPYTVVVGAMNAKGESSSYSSPGANIWITGPGGEYGYLDPPESPEIEGAPAILTTDFSGCSSGSSKSSSTVNDFESGSALNSNCNYTSTMNGTSSATPNVVGVIALILEANPDLSWRDVKHILASTARNIDFVFGTYGHPLGVDLAGHAYQQAWVKNAADYYFHNYYGFGLVDAEAAVAMAKNYNVNLGTFVNTNWVPDSGGISRAIPDNSATGVTDTLNVTNDYIIEAIQIKVSITHEYVENLGIELTSPSGTKSIITNINSAVLDSNLSNAIFLSNAFYGEESKGIWTLKVIDGARTNSDGSVNKVGTLTNWKINVFGHAK